MSLGKKESMSDLLGMGQSYLLPFVLFPSWRNHFGTEVYGREEIELALDELVILIELQCSQIE